MTIESMILYQRAISFTVMRAGNTRILWSAANCGRYFQSITSIIFAALPIVGTIAGAAMKKPVVWRVSGSILSLEVFFVLGLILEFMVGFPVFDTLFGASMLWLAVVVCLGLFLISLLLIWKPFKAVSCGHSGSSLS